MGAITTEDPDVWVNHPGPWTEEEFLALQESRWVELVDGSLLVNPSPGALHQDWTRRLANFLEAAAPETLNVHYEVNVRIVPGRIRIPDVVVTHELHRSMIFEGSRALLVAEVVSPGSGRRDRDEKAIDYAMAGIPWYLVVEPDDGGRPAFWLRRLEVERYVDHARASCGQTMQFPDVGAEIDPAQLDRRHT
ncbi:Uma2 family endonuclease [Actinopolymorpha sp. B9G3]|uniref:Uma2 family endonuclease n=1 Tax=Actinopolymorpha sp. B9G3 TaxID=3158970 RepID=UPI0032D9989E